LGNSIKLTLYNIIALIETYCKSKIFEAFGECGKFGKIVLACANLGSVSEAGIGAAYKVTFGKNPKLGSAHGPRLLALPAGLLTAPV